MWLELKNDLWLTCDNTLIVKKKPTPLKQLSKTASKITRIEDGYLTQIKSSNRRAVLPESKSVLLSNGLPSYILSL